MSSRGYPSQTKLDRVKSEFATMEPVREEQQALSVLSHMYVYEVGTDAAEASSTTYVINATAHAALKGDVIRFTSGTHSGKEIKVYETTANTITLVQNLSAAVATGVNFQILRHKYPVVDAAGALSVTASGSAGPIQFDLDGVATDVFKDTLTPANSRPLPVEITGVSGPINITAGDLNVALDSANDSVAAVQSGTWNITNVSGTVSLPTGAATEASLATVAGDTTSLDAKVPSQGQALMAASLPVVIASNQSAISVADGGGSLTVDGTLAVTQSGTWNIADVTGTVSLPTGASTSALQTTGNTSLGTLAGAVSGTEMQVDIVTQPALSSGTDSVAAVQSGVWNIADVTGTVSLPTGAATSALQTTGNTSLSTLAGAVSGTEVQVDVLTQPALSSGTDSVAAVQSGTWNITNVSGTVSLPTGAATLTEQQTQTTSLQLIDDAVATTGAAITAKGIAAVGTDGTNARVLKTDASGELQVDVLTLPAITPTYLDVVDFIDTNPALDTSSTNIPGSAGSPVTIVASLAADVKKVQFLDTTGAFIGLYTGAAASEVLQAVFGPGSDQTIEVQLTSGQRVSLLRLDSTTAISSGFVSVNFIG